MIYRPDGFIQAILADPQDDVLRLIFADWLEEHGNADQSEFIRVQVELARLPAVDPRRPGLEARERGLLAEHERTWVGALAPFLARWEFGRGLLEQFAFNSDRLGYAGSVALAETPCLGWRTTLDLKNKKMGNAGAETLLASPYLARLTALSLRGNYLGPDAVRALVASPYLPRLAGLDLSNNAIEDEGARVLAESPLLARLRRLDVRNSYVGRRGQEALTAAAPPSLRLLLTSARAEGTIWEL